MFCRGEVVHGAGELARMIMERGQSSARWWVEKTWNVRWTEDSSVRRTRAMDLGDAMCAGQAQIMCCGISKDPSKYRVIYRLKKWITNQVNYGL